MKSLFERIGGTYHEENGYLIPNLTLPDEEQVEPPILLTSTNRLRICFFGS